ncbi:MAG: DUF192 domain-containing protein [Chloroflexi bacterium]|nr:DUF192 domain-containing protein [Chloroflexota bacterium]
MQKITIINTSRPQARPISAFYYPDFWGKLMGLMFKKKFDSLDSIILDQKKDTRLNSAIHMLFMNFDIAAIWVNSDMKVVDTRNAKSWALAYFPKGPARYIIETTPDFLGEYQSGDRLEFRDE